MRLVLYGLLRPSTNAIISRTASLLYFIVLVGDSKAPGRSLSVSTGLRSHTASVKIDRPIFALASNLLKRLVALLVASRAGKLAKPEVRPPSPYSTVPSKTVLYDE